MQQNSRKRTFRRFIRLALLLLLAAAFLCTPVASASANIWDFLVTPTPTPKPTPTPTSTPSPTPTPTPTPKPTPTPTPMPTVCPYETVSLNVGGKQMTAYVVEFGGMQRDEPVGEATAFNFETMNGYYYELRGTLRDCIGLRIVVDYDVTKGNPRAFNWKPVVWLDNEEKWSSGATKNVAKWNEEDRFIGDVLFKQPTEFYYAACVPAKKTSSAWGINMYFGIERMYFSTPEGATAYYNSLF